MWVYRQLCPACWSGSVHDSCPWPLEAGLPGSLSPGEWRTSHLEGHCFLDQRTQALNICSQPLLSHVVEPFIYQQYLCACGPEHRPTRRRRAGAGAAAGSWALHGRGLRKQTKTWRSFGRNGWSSNRGSADSGRALHWELPFYAASPHPLMQKMCLRERHHRSNHLILWPSQLNVTQSMRSSPGGVQVSNGDWTKAERLFVGMGSAIFSSLCLASAACTASVWMST